MPFLRPMATIIEDTLGWYGMDEFGGAVHDVIGTRCDPYTHNLLSGGRYHHCCHSNLSPPWRRKPALPVTEIEHMVHDVLNVFMCTGFTRDTGQYFMKASPVRPGDYLEFFAEIDLLGALSACPGGDCSSEHSSDVARCHPLLVEVFAPPPAHLALAVPRPRMDITGSTGCDLPASRQGGPEVGRGPCQPHQLQIEISHQEGRVHIRADGVTGEEFRGGSFCIFITRSLRTKYSILVQIGVIVRENLGHKWPKSFAFTI